MDLDMKKGNYNCVRRNRGRIIFHLEMEKTQVQQKPQKGLKTRTYVGLHSKTCAWQKATTGKVKEQMKSCRKTADLFFEFRL